MKVTCRQDAYPAPEWVLEPGGLWVTFTYAPDHVEQETGAIESTNPQVTPQVEHRLSGLLGSGCDEYTFVRTDAK